MRSGGRAASSWRRYERRPTGSSATARCGKRASSDSTTCSMSSRKWRPVMANDRGSGKLEITLPSDTEILMTRMLESPRHLVFEALTRPEHVRRWWCCMDGFTMPVCEMDVRVGGRWRYVIVGPPGEVAFH